MRSGAIRVAVRGGQSARVRRDPLNSPAAPSGGASTQLFPGGSKP